MTYKRLIADFEALKDQLVVASQDVQLQQELKHISSLSLYEVIKTQEQADIFMKTLLAPEP